MIVARPAALKSVWVMLEVEVALAHGCIPVLIDINDTVTAAPETSALAVLARSDCISTTRECARWRLTRLVASPDLPNGVGYALQNREGGDPVPEEDRDTKSAKTKWSDYFPWPF